MNWAKTTATRDKNHLRFGIWCILYQRHYGTFKKKRHQLVHIHTSLRSSYQGVGWAIRSRMTAEIILCIGPNNERQYYSVTPSLIGWRIHRMIPMRGCPIIIVPTDSRWMHTAVCLQMRWNCLANQILYNVIIYYGSGIPHNWDVHFVKFGGHQLW